MHPRISSQTFLFLTVFLCCITDRPAALEAPAGQNAPLRLEAETGFLAVASHKIQFSKNGTYFDYVQDGGQDILFPVTRFGADWRINERHSVILLYQPLALSGEAVLQRSLVVDSLTFPAGTPMGFFYGFPFYRASYLYDFRPEPDRELSLGASLQVRNATIVFRSLDGTLLRTQRDIGPVPVLKARWRWPVSTRHWLGAEIDGIYAPVSYLNGSDEEVTGALVDASLRAGTVLAHGREAFLNLRYLAGGAVGTNSEEDGPGDGYVKNWLHFVTVTLCLAMGL